MSVLALREDLDLTLGALRDDLGGEGTNPVADISLDSLRINADAATPSIALGSIEVPMTDRGVTAMADALQVPAPFIKRLGDRGGLTAQGELLSMVLNHTPGGVVRAEYIEDGGLVELRDPNQVRVQAGQLLRVAESVLGTHEAPIQRLVDTTSEFSFDVHVPFDYSRGVGGDPDSLLDLPTTPDGDALALQEYSWMSKVPLDGNQRVGDLTAAGLRFHLDRKRGLTPSVQPWMMRLWCTNGAESTTTETKIDGRGMSVEEVLADLEVKAEAAFSAMERQMVHFYDLRNQRVNNPERRLRAIARERGIPARSLNVLLDAAPALLGDETTEFDIVNAVTNLANHSSVRNEGGRLLLERAGGSVVSDHSLRCASCHTALVH